MNKILKQNCFKLGAIAFAVIAIFSFAYCSGQKNKERLSINNTNENSTLGRDFSNVEPSVKEPTIYHTKEELCSSLSPQDPSPEENKINIQIKKDPFVKHLRKVLDAFLNGKTIPCQDSSCYSNDIAYYIESSEIDVEYLKGKFIVLQTDIAPGGGESIIVLFKDKPDQVFYVWVYGGKKGEKYDVRGFNEFGKLSEKRLSKSDLQDTQKIFVNQICSDKFGI